MPGATLFDCADRRGIRVPTSCHREGTCHECIVEVTRGLQALATRTAHEDFLRGNYRLACQAVVEDPAAEIEFAPLVRRPQILTATPPAEAEIDPVAARREGHAGRRCGLAADVGTTTVVLELVDLETGAGLALASFENPQRFGGSDVMHRISYEAGPGRGELQRAVISAVNREVREMCEAAGVAADAIEEAVVVGNATMRDLFFGVDVQSIGQRPYKSQIEQEYRAGRRATTALTQPARELGLLLHPEALAYGGPLVASHVGADAAAALLATGMLTTGETALLVDVGTNTEVVLAHRGRLVAASCPAGPAFEGGLVRYGMPGREGAIEALRLNGDGWHYRTIGGGPPHGICGSGLVDLVAELRRRELMTPKGVFAAKAREIAIVPERGITFSREDASHLAQAKAANYCGQYIVMRSSGVRPEEIDHLYLAGAFANYLEASHAIEIGLLAPVPEARIVKIGNAALAGARQMLLSGRRRRALEARVGEIEHLELETTPDFFEIFVEGCQFKPMPGATS